MRKTTEKEKEKFLKKTTQSQRKEKRSQTINELKIY